MRPLKDVRGILAALAVVSACTSGPPPPDNRPYEQKIEQWRKDKDVMFKSGGSESPLTPADRATFAGLPYFPIDHAYDVPAFLTREQAGPLALIELQTSTNERRRMQRVGTLGFSVTGTPLTLAAFADLDSGSINRLFVPFTDATSGTETYGAGRYLIDSVKGADQGSDWHSGKVTLDFNLAYHPSCAYDPKWNCPLAPPQSRLTLPVQTGERLAAGH
jgi:uncharacterized protein (DUF1684 family)